MNVDINASPGTVLWWGGEALMVPLCRVHKWHVALMEGI